MDKQALERKTIGEFRYEVFFDLHDNLNEIDFEDEQDKNEYLRKFETGEVTSFGVVKSKVCECCCSWSEVDSLWGIHCETAEEALKIFLEE